MLTELLQNAVDHAFPPTDDLQAAPVSVALRLDDDGRRARGATVIDDGVGLPEGSRSTTSTGLGLSIVRTLVTSELHGTIEMHGDGRATPGTVVTPRARSPTGAGTGADHAPG